MAAIIEERTSCSKGGPVMAAAAINGPGNHVRYNYYTGLVDGWDQFARDTLLYQNARTVKRGKACLLFYTSPFKVGPSALCIYTHLR